MGLFCLPLLSTAQISAKYARNIDIERYGNKALEFEFRSNGEVKKCTYKRDNYERIKDWNATCTYGHYTITQSDSRISRITIIWSNGRQEKYYIDYRNSHYTTLHTDYNSNVGKGYKEVL